MTASESRALTHSIVGPVKDAYLLLVAHTEGPRVCASPGRSVTLELDEVRRAERQAALSFDAPHLLLFSELGSLTRWELGLDRLATHGEEAAEAGVPEALVPLGRRRRARRRFWICVERAASAPEIIEYEEESRAQTRLRLEAWLEEVAAIALDNFRSREEGRDSPYLSREERAALEAWAQRATLEVRLHAADASEQPSLYRVRHAKFGEGVVRREEPAGPDTKIVVDFGAGGVRTLLERFVQRI